MNNFDPFNVRRKHNNNNNNTIFPSPTKKASSDKKPAVVHSSFHELDDISDPFTDPPRTSHESSSLTAAGGMSSYAIPRGATPLGSENTRDRAEWQQRHNRTHSGQHKTTAGEKINSMFASKGELPMYKDKPYNYSGSSRRPFYRKRRILLIIPAVLALLLYITSFRPGSSSERSTRSKTKTSSWFSGSKVSSVDWSERQEKVREAFRINWKAYETYAWGE